MSRRLPLVALCLTVWAAAPAPLRANDAALEEIPRLVDILPRQWRRRPPAPLVPPTVGPTGSDRKPASLSLREAVHAAVAGDPGLLAEAYGPQQARIETGRVWATFDPVLELDGSVGREVTPTGSSLAGALTLRERRNDFSLALQKRLRTGATFRFDFAHGELQTNSFFLGLSPQYRSQLGVELRQPLLRDSGLGLTTLLVRSSDAGLGEAYYAYRERVAEQVLEVVGEYWQIVLARKNLEAETEGWELARRLEADSRERVAAGVLAPIAATRAAAEAAAREERRIRAGAELELAEDRLRLRVQRDAQNHFLPQRIEAKGDPDAASPRLEVDEVRALRDAVLHRPELRRARLEIEGLRADLALRENALLPKLELQARYGLNGLAGRSAALRDVESGETLATPFDGSVGRGLERLVDDSFNSYSAGLRLEIPLGNAAAETDFVHSRIELRRAELRYRRALADATVDVRAALRDLRTAGERVAASRVARELAEENLVEEKARLEAGLSIPGDVLESQERLTVARLAEMRARVDRAIGVARLARSRGLLLDDFDIRIEEPASVPAPFWAQF